MKPLKFLILVGQLGRIWARSRKQRKIYQSLTAIGFFSLLFTPRKNRKYFNDDDY